VTVLSPGASATAFGAVARQKDTAPLRMLMMQPRPVARTGILAMLRHRTSVVAGTLNKLVVFFFRFTPRQMQREVMQRVMSG
jgi:short-subunit dehydrogenase